MTGSMNDKKLDQGQVARSMASANNNWLRGIESYMFLW